MPSDSDRDSDNVPLARLYRQSPSSPVTPRTLRSDHAGSREQLRDHESDWDNDVYNRRLVAAADTVDQSRHPYTSYVRFPANDIQPVCSIATASCEDDTVATDSTARFMPPEDGHVAVNTRERSAAYALAMLGEGNVYEGRAPQ